MSAIETIGNAIPYEADEAILAHGGSFAEFQAMAIRLSDLRAESEGDESPVSLRPTVRTEAA